MKPRLLFVVESGTDVRLVDGLAERFELRIIAREIKGGAAISHRPELPVEIVKGPDSHIRFARFAFGRLLRDRSSYDAVLVQGYGLAALAANLARQFSGKPTFMIVCSPAEAYYECRRQFSSGRRYRKHEASAIKLLARANALLGDQYVVLSRYLENVVRSRGGRRVHFIPVYGVDTRQFAPASESKQQLKAELGLPTTGTLIFFSSRIAPEKDSETLLRAVRRLLDEGQSIWILHRSGGYREFLADAERFGVGSRVIATDAVHPHGGLTRDYQACGICVQASREEGLGFSPLEALACETPVVASAVGGLQETIIDGHTGWSYPVGDDAALARAIAEAIAHPDEAMTRARNGRQLVIERFERSSAFTNLAALVRDSIGEVTHSEGTTERSPHPERKRPLRILLATHVFRKGHAAVYRNTCQRAAYFESRGHSCTVVAPDDFPWVQRWHARMVPLLFPIALARWMAQQQDPFDVTMFHSHAGWAVSLLRRFFGKFPNLRIAIMFHGLEPLYYQRLKREVQLTPRYRFMYGFLMEKLLRFSCHNAEMLMCLNSEEAQFLAENNWSRGQVYVVTNPGPNGCFRIARKFHEQVRRLLFIGQWLPMKGTKYLVQAFTSLHSKFPEVQLCCAGTLTSEAEVLASFPNSVAGNVSILPLLDPDELPAVVADSDIFVFPTLSEGASLALAEAMAGALPIVTTRVGAAPDLLKHDESVVFVSPGDASALADAVERLLHDKALREKLGRNARAAATSLDPSIVWRAYADCVDKLMGWEVKPAPELEHAVSATGAQ
jgi:glycosyltransferase involved in cell wall biosynthesis